VGDNHHSAMLHSVEAKALSAHASASTSNEQHESDVHRLAFSAAVSPRSVAAVENHFPPVEGEARYDD
jgi:hypothetical protein